jgi:hypothetical protein
VAIRTDHSQVVQLVVHPVTVPMVQLERYRPARPHIKVADSASPIEHAFSQEANAKAIRVIERIPDEDFGQWARGYH